MADNLQQFVTQGNDDLSAFTGGMDDLSAFTGGMDDLSAFTGGADDLSAFMGGNDDLSAFTGTGAPSVAPIRDPNSFSSGVGRAIDNNQAALYGAAEALGETFDLDEIARWGSDGKVRNIEQAAKYGDPIQLKDADTLGEFLSWGITNTGSLLADVAPYVAAGAAGAVAGGPLGSIAAMGAVSAPLSLGQVKLRSEELQGEDSELSLGEYGLAAGLTALDVVGVGKLQKLVSTGTVKQVMEKEGVEATRDAIEKGLTKGGVASSVAKDAAEATVTSLAMATISTAAIELGTHHAAGLEIDEDDFINRMREAAAVSILGGAPFGAAGSYIRNKNLKKFMEPEEAPAVAERKSGFFWDAWNTYTGKAFSTLAPAISGTQAGQSLISSVNNVVDTQRKLRARITSNEAEIEKAAKAEYGRGWEQKLIEDYQNGVSNKATDELTNHLNHIAHDSVDLKMMKPEDIVDRYLPANMDKDKILGNWEQFSKEVLDEATRENAQKPLDKQSTPEEVKRKVDAKLGFYREGLELGNWSAISRRFQKLSDEDTADLTKAEAKLKQLVEGDKQKTGKIQSDKVQRELGNIEGNRLFDAGQDFYNKWSLGGNKGVYGWDSVRAYGQRAAHRMAGVNAWGLDGEKLNQMILESQVEMKGQGKSLTGADIARIYEVVDAYDNNLGRIQSDAWRNISQAAKITVNTTTLPLVTLGSLTELFNVAMKTDMTTMLRATVRVASSAGVNLARKAAFRQPTERHLSNSTQLQYAGQTFGQSQHYMANRLTDPTMSDTAAKWMNRFFKMTGLTYWTQFVRNVGAEATRIQVAEDITTLTNFPGTGAAQRADARLTELGIVGNRREALAPNKSTSKETRNQIMGDAINMFNKNVVLDPSFADRPLWMSNQKFWILAQLQGYPTMFTNTVLPMLGDKLKGAPNQVIDGLFILGGITLTGAAQIALRDMAAGRDPDDREDWEMALEPLHRFVSPKPINAVTNALTSARFGATPSETAIGPVASVGGDVIELHRKLIMGDLKAEEYAQGVLETVGPARAFRKHWQ